MRIKAIDILRGFALLGILLMNIMSFAMPNAAYYNPLAYGGDGLNLVWYWLVHIFADQKFMGLFSMLFGASIILATRSAEKKARFPILKHYMRNIWLLIFGFAHFLFVWTGDVLMVYSLCGSILYFFRKLSPKIQFALGLIFFIVPSLFQLYAQQQIPDFSSRSSRAVAQVWQPSSLQLSSDLGHYRGDYTDQVAKRWAEEFDYSGIPSGESLYYDVLWTDYIFRAMGMMLVGMAYFQWGILAASKSQAFYRRMVWLGLVGVLLSAIGVWLNIANDWSWEYAVFQGKLLNNLATPLTASGYVGLIMLWSMNDIGAKLKSRLEAVGRTAFTCYITQSLMATFIFYGWGLGLYGQLNRLTQLLVVLLIWGIQLWLAPLWLKSFRQGPLEWLWRSLVDFKVRPLLK